MLGKKLKRLRIEKRCTLTEVANEVGVTCGSMSKYEHDVHKPGDLVLKRLAGFYGLTVEEMLEGTDDEPVRYDGNRVCPWRVQKDVDMQSGNTTTCFLPCLGRKCMAFENERCGMMKRDYK